MDVAKDLSPVFGVFAKAVESRSARRTQWALSRAASDVNALSTLTGSLDKDKFKIGSVKITPIVLLVKVLLYTIKKMNIQ